MSKTKAEIDPMEVQPHPKPDDTNVQQDGGYYFTAWGIHVVAKTQKEAKAKALEYFGADVDKDIPPPKDIVDAGVAQAEANNETKKVPNRQS